jgi:endonuclease/exonuclease/phosphatase family metal-dependent hydrolase
VSQDEPEPADTVPRCSENVASVSWILVATALLAASPAPEPEGPSGLRVLTFNILHSSFRNVAGTWETRRPLVVQTIRDASPDVVCVQEASALQVIDLARDLPGYTVIAGATSGATAASTWWLSAAGILALGWILAGRSRARSRMRSTLRIFTASGAVLSVAALAVVRFLQGDFMDRGEHCPILVHAERFASTRHGTFWDSAQPDRPGSMHGGGLRPHIVTWADLTDRATGARYTVYNAHLGIEPWVIPRTAALLRARLDRDRRGWPQILAGDLNAKPEGVLMRALVSDRDPGTFHDAWSQAASRSGPGYTFHWGLGRPGPRIDYVLVRPRLPVDSAAVIASREPPFASDHHPVLAIYARLLHAGTP